MSFEPCPGCTSPMACRDRAYCNIQASVERPSSVMMPVPRGTPTPEQRIAMSTEGQHLLAYGGGRGAGGKGPRARMHPVNVTVQLQDCSADAVMWWAAGRKIPGLELGVVTGNQITLRRAGWSDCNLFAVLLEIEGSLPDIQKGWEAMLKSQRGSTLDNGEKDRWPNRGPI